MNRIILHSDMNGFYASCECLYHPELNGLPVAVGGDKEQRHGIILAKNELAKACHVQTGEALWQAQEKCPNLVILKPNYPLYQRFSRKARQIYYEYTDQVEPYGLDEAWLDCTESGSLFGSGPSIAEEIRRRIKEELGLTVSIGVSWNKIFAKFGSDYKKPDAVTVIDEGNYREIVWPRPVGELLYVGPATRRRLRSIGVTTIGRLAALGRERLELEFGKMGGVLYEFANGLDRSPVKGMDEGSLDNARLIKSVGNSTTAPRPLRSMREFKLVLWTLSESVSMRLREIDCLAGLVEVYVRYENLHGFLRQHSLLGPTDATRRITEAAEALFMENYDFYSPIRSLGVRVSKLTPRSAPMQLSFFEDYSQVQKERRLDRVLDILRGRYGNNIVRRGVTIGDEMSALDPKRDNTIHPMGYFQGAL